MATDMVTVEVTINGISPLLQHRFGEAAEASTGAGADGVRAVGPESGEDTPRSRAELAAYRYPSTDDKPGALYHPGSAISRLLREAGSNHKQAKSRKMLKWIVPSAILVREDTIDLIGPDGGPLYDYEVDARPVVIPATKGRVMRYRPRLERWSANITLEIVTSLISVTVAHQLLEEGGRQLGIGDYRPEKGGPFGWFEITNWRVLE